VKSLASAVKRRTSQAFLLSGPSGVGKTTLARIAASQLGVKQRDLTEVDGATYTGIDNMRKLQETLRYRPMAGEARGVIVDECGRLSAQAWDSCLKVIEEPPEFLFWFFCTTDLHKVPKAIKTRCLHISLKDIKLDQLQRLVISVIKQERSRMPEGVMQVVCREANGSARQALVNFALCYDAVNQQQARELLKETASSDVIAELCKLLLSRGSMLRAVELIDNIETHDYEQQRLAINRYLSAVLRGQKSNEGIGRMLNILDAFCVPYNAGEGAAPLYLSVGRVLLSE
jgi:DNA polymerase-3 subunit gamma/tau